MFGGIDMTRYSEEMRFFIYLLELYAAHKRQRTGDVLKAWDAKNITQRIYDNYWVYHTERPENAFADIDSLLVTGPHASFCRMRVKGEK